MLSLDFFFETGHQLVNNSPIKGLFTWSGGPRSSGVSFFCFHALGETKQKKLTQLDRGPQLHVNRVLMSLRSKVDCGSEVFDKLGSQLTRMRTVR